MNCCLMRFAAGRRTRSDEYLKPLLEALPTDARSFLGRDLAVAVICPVDYPCCRRRTGTTCHSYWKLHNSAFPERRSKSPGI